MKTIAYYRGRLAKRSADSPPACIHQGESKGYVKVECCGGAMANHRSYECSLHGRCLPGYNPAGKAEKLWLARIPESEVYQLCMRCEDRQTSADGAVSVE